jgi:SWI/SNF-related matrix-associated actin-dependent regulator of chromatin subfamily A-like protein 1
MALIVIDHGHEFHVYWDWDHWAKRNLEAVKSIDPATDRRYVNDPKKGKKYWWVSGSQRAEILKWQQTHHARIEIPENMRPEETGTWPPMPELTIDLPWRNGVVPREYQNQGIAQGIKFERTLIGDEQGLGKTLESVGVMIGLEVIGKSPFPCFVVCPATAKPNWKREWEKWSHKRCMILDSSMPAQQRRNWFSYVAAGLVDVVIINYESIDTFCVESYPKEKTKTGKKVPWKAEAVKLKEFMSCFKGGILDESHKCKDPTTNQSKFILRIFNTLPYRLLLSGTPVVNKPVDLFAQLGILGQLKHFGGATGFKKRYCGENEKGASNLRELNYKLNTHCFFRREKKEVAKDLPEKMRQIIYCDITTRVEYERCRQDFEQYLIDQGVFDDEAIARRLRGIIMTRMQMLKQISAQGKMNEVKEFVNEVLESGEKLVVFCHLHDIVDKCLHLWPHAVTVTGRDSMDARDRNILRFQTDPACNLIVCNHQAAGVAITLTASSRVAFIEYPWHYASCVQCEDRTHRIGQVNNVMCTYFSGIDTVDDRMLELIMEKMATGNTITGATDTMEMEMVDRTLSLFKKEKYVSQ